MRQGRPSQPTRLHSGAPRKRIHARGCEHLRVLILARTLVPRILIVSSGLEKAARVHDCACQLLLHLLHELPLTTATLGEVIIAVTRHDHDDAIERGTLPFAVHLVRHDTLVLHLATGCDRQGRRFCRKVHNGRRCDVR